MSGLAQLSLREWYRLDLMYREPGQRSSLLPCGGGVRTNANPDILMILQAMRNQILEQP
jgi:hypothetical protein